MSSSVPTMYSRPNKWFSCCYYYYYCSYLPGHSLPPCWLLDSFCASVQIFLSSWYIPSTYSLEWLLVITQLRKASLWSSEKGLCSLVKSLRSQHPFGATMIMGQLSDLYWLEEIMFISILSIVGILESTSCPHQWPHF
jgi:hypothetical protein